jgi:hypothetical protein
MALLGNLVVNVLGDTKGLESSLSQAQKKMRNVAKNLTSIGTKMSALVTLPLAGIGIAALKVASDAEEMESKFNVVFGELAGEAKTWADEFGDSVNRSTASVMGWMAALQDTFVPLGFARAEGAEMSKTLAQLTVDMASFNNESEANVIRDLQSALVGNHETVRKYGVIITQATLDQELMNMGIQDGIKAATEQQKVLARMNIILKGTTDAQGDAVRTAGSFANRMRALKESTKDLLIGLGNQLIPIVSSLVEKVTAAVKWFDGLNDKQKRMIIMVAGIVAAIGPVLMALGAFVSALGVLISPIGLVITAVAALATAGVLLWKNWDKVTAFLKAMWEDLKKVGVIVFNSLKLAILSYMRGYLTAVTAAARVLGKVFGFEVKKLEGALAAVNAEFDDTVGKIKDTASSTWESTQYFKGFGEKIKGLAGNLKELAGKLKDVVVDGIDVQGAVNGIAESMGNVAGEIEKVNEGLDNLSQTMALYNQQVAEWTGADVISLFYAQVGVQERVIEVTDEMIEKWRVYYDLMKNYVTPVSIDSQEHIVQLMDASRDKALEILPIWQRSWETMGDVTMSMAEKLKEVIKDLLATWIESLGKKLLIKAMEALVPIPGLFNPAGAVAAFAASAAAFTAAGFIRSLKEGGLIPGYGGGDTVPVMLEPGEMVIRKEAARENRPLLEAMNTGRGEIVIHNHLYLDGDEVLDFISRATDDRRLLIHRDAIVE